MNDKLSFDLPGDAGELARHGGWTIDVYADLLAIKRGDMTTAAFSDKYRRNRAILVLDTTGFTKGTHEGNVLPSFLRILDVRRICIPTMEQFSARFIRCFADDVVALFDDPVNALHAAIEIQRRVVEFNAKRGPDKAVNEVCIGIGYGEVFAIGPNKAMGDEMNKASKLGEDTARGGEILVTPGFLGALRSDGTLTFERQEKEDVPFPFYRLDHF